MLHPTTWKRDHGVQIRGSEWFEIENVELERVEARYSVEK